MKTDLIKKAFLKSIPVMAGYLLLGIGFGVYLRDAGYGVLWSAAMCVLIYAGSMQFAGVSLISGAAGILTTIFTTIAVNARHLFYSISMVKEYRGAGKYKPYLIFALTDETYSLLCDGSFPEGMDKHAYRFFVSLFNQCYWVTGGLVGNLLGDIVPFSTAGIEFSMTALFVATFVSQWKKTHNHIPALTGLAISIICLFLFGAERFLIPSMLLITASLLFIRERMTTGKEVPDDF